MERLDLASLRSVRTFAEKISYEVKLDPLGNNVGSLGFFSPHFHRRRCDRPRLPFGNMNP